MTAKERIRQVLGVSLVIVGIFSIQPYTTWPIGNTFTWWFINGFLLIAFAIERRNSNSPLFDKKSKWMNFFIWYMVFSSIRGLFVAETYWDYKGLVGNIISILTPLVAFLVTNPPLFQKVLRNFMRFGLPLFLIIAAIITRDAYGFYLSPIAFFLLFFAALSARWKWLVFVISIFVLVADQSARSNIIKFAFPLLLIFVYYFRQVLSIKFLKTFSLILFAAPIVFFSLAVTETFNVFKMDEYIKGDFIKVAQNEEGDLVEEDLKSDTRTSLYAEVLGTAKEYNSWIVGRSPARGNSTVLFSSLSEITGREERLGNEVGILNIFTWTGLVGVFLFFMVCMSASMLAINHSNNVFSKMLGIYIAFRWAYAWVEDPNYFNIMMWMLWFMIGMAYSPFFRGLTNAQYKLWIMGIFNRKSRLKFSNLVSNRMKVLAMLSSSRSSNRTSERIEEIPIHNKIQ